jgi:hypothetical protein
MTASYSQTRKFVVFGRRRFVITNSRPIPACALVRNPPYLSELTVPAAMDFTYNPSTTRAPARHACAMGSV